MKNLTTLFLALLIVFIAGGTLFAQAGDENIWSIVKIDPNEPEKIELPTWVPAEPVVRYFDLGDGVTVFPNFRPKPTTNSTQSEMSVDVHPANNSIVFGSANASNWPVSTIYGTGVYWSLDGSTTWVGTDDPGTLSGFGRNSGDPVSVIGQDGRFYENYISNSSGQGVSVSTNNGVTWTSHIVAPNPGSLADKNHFMVDKTPTSPYLHRAYCVWTDFGGANNYDAVLRYSTNFGQTWTSSINLSNALSSYLNQGANVQTGPNGEVYATWTVYIDGSVSTGEDGIGFAKSTDGGITWSAPTYAYQATNFGIRSTSLPGKGIRCNSFPSMAVDRSGGLNNGTIYITWAQRGVAPAGSDPDIVLIKSTNGGTTWTSPVRVNNDPLSNGKDQILPWCTVDQANGQLLFVFYDSRNVPNNQAEVFMARSANGGVTFDNFVVSDQAFVLDPISGFSGNYAGDYIGVAAYDEIAYPYWMSEQTGNAQGWMAKVEFGPPCPIDPASNPVPGNGAIDIPITGNTATWSNGAGANQIEVWFGEAGNLVQVYNGAPISSFSLAPVEPLDYSTTYGWQIVGKNDTCDVNGPVWTFTTIPDPNLVIDTLFCEAFEGGLGGWTVTNDGGSSGCVWQTRFSPFPNSYTLPATSTGGIMTADVDDCGTGSTLLSTATLNQTFDLSIYTSMVWIEFDNDWNVLDAQDEAHIEVSIDGGTIWTGVWDQVGTDIRNSHEVVDVTALVSGQSNVKFRLRSVQPGWDWWWVLDNFCIYGMYIVPVELTSFAAQVVKDGVELNWRTATETNNQGFEIERMTEGAGFEQVGYVAGFGTTTEPKVYSFVDSKLEAGSYSYRLKQIDFNGSFSYSEEVYVDITLPLEYTLEQNYPNPFNPSTTIKYSIAEDGFVKLSIFNMLGEEVATLVNTQQKAGRYEINFNATGLSSGVYVYRIEAENFSASKKLMLMK